MAGRNTIQRQVVLEELRGLANHPTADEVYESVHAKHPSISKATVYRILNKLAEEGVALRVKINNGADHFDHQVFDHYHVRCVRCGKVDDVEVPSQASLEEQAARTSGYQICGHTLQFDGICPECQKS